MIWFYLTLGALLFWSFGDLFSKIGTDQKDPHSHWKIAMAVGLVMGLHAGYSLLFDDAVHLSWALIAAYLPASLCYIASMVLGYVGLRYIELSVSSPICNASGALSFLLMLIFMRSEVVPEEGMGSPLFLLSLLAVGLVCAGVVALGIVEMREDEETKIRRREASNRQYAKSFLALLFPLLYCLLDSAGTFADAFIMGGDNILSILEATVPGLSEMSEEAVENIVAMSCNTAYELTFLMMGAAAFIYVVLIKKEKFNWRLDGCKGINGICETAGQVCYALVIADTDHAAFAAAVIASYSALSALWGRVFIKEKLSHRHYLAIGITLAGIILMGALDP